MMNTLQSTKYQPCFRLKSLTTVMPIGMQRSESSERSDGMWHYMSVNVTWTPSANDSGRDHALCYYATDANG